MPHVKQTTVYLYNELSPEAQAKARNWMRQADQGDNYFAESVIEDFAVIAGFCGWDILQRTAKLMDGTTRHEAAVFWSGFWSQGDGACFEGRWSARRVNYRALKAHAPKEGELQRIGRVFAQLKKATARMDAVASVRNVGRGSASYNTDFEAHGLGERMYESRMEDLKEASRDLMDWLYKALEAEYDYHNSEEQIAESIVASAYEFLEDGSLA